MESIKRFVPGITVRSVFAAIFCMMVMGMQIQYVEVILSDGSALAEQSLPLPAVNVFITLSLLVALLAAAFKTRLLSRAELFCVLFTMLLSAPMMTQGMWHRFVGLTAATPRTSAFSYIDAYSDKLWPHGPNLVPNAFSADKAAGLATSGNPVQWESIEYEKGVTALLPVLVNTAPDQVSSISVRVPLLKGGKPWLVPGEPYLLSFLTRPADLGPDSFYFCRVYNDNQPTYSEVVNTKERAKPTFLHKKGFLRVGNYGVKFSSDARESVRLEFGLSGTGKLALHDPRLYSVGALEGAYTGYKIIRRSDYEKLPEGERTGLIVKPDNLWSFAGLKFLLSGYIPVRPWLLPAFSWSAMILLLLTAMFSLNVIMRKQWAESERYPFPMFQIPNALLGDMESAEPYALPPIWKNRSMWAGFAVSLFWGMMRGWNFYNHRVPDLNINVQLNQYLSDPGWGGMWNVDFTISAVIVAIAIFFELNVLLSLVIGFFLFRSLLWVGETTGAKAIAGYPFRYEQTVGAYIAYALIVVFFLRKYLWQVLKDAVRGRGPTYLAEGEPFSKRVALMLLGVAFAGIAAWALWLKVSVLGILLYFIFLVLVGFVASKFRAECGLPTGYFTPYNAMLFVSLLGGLKVFGCSGMMVCLIASGFLTVSVFYFIPGAQLEMLEFGRRARIVPRHLVYTAVLGALGGLFIGGWVFLSNSYAIGGDNIRYQWSYNQAWFFHTYRTELATATSEELRQLSGSRTPQAQQAQQVPQGWWTRVKEAVPPQKQAYVLGGLATILVTVLRQLFAGFWFHPIGVVLGPAHMLEWAWGSCLVAWFIRYVVLKLGGAATVRKKLLPFFVGVFVAAVLTLLIWNLYGFYLQSHGVERIYGALP